MKKILFLLAFVVMTSAALAEKAQSGAAMDIPPSEITVTLPAAGGQAVLFYDAGGKIKINGYQTNAPHITFETDGYNLYVVAGPNILGNEGYECLVNFTYSDGGSITEVYVKQGMYN